MKVMAGNLPMTSLTILNDINTTELKFFVSLSTKRHHQVTKKQICTYNLYPIRTGIIRHRKHRGALPKSLQRYLWDMVLGWLRRCLWNRRRNRIHHLYLHRLLWIPRFGTRHGNRQCDNCWCVRRILLMCWRLLGWRGCCGEGLSVYGADIVDAVLTTLEDTDHLTVGGGDTLGYLAGGELGGDW